MKEKYTKMNAANNLDSTNDSASSSNNENNQLIPPIGGIVRCTTCLGNNVQGKVVAYDHVTQMLVLRISNPTKSNLYDISFINLDWCNNLEIIEEPNEPPEIISNLNMNKITRRIRDNVDNKYKEINSLGKNVSTVAQHLYFTILKTLSEVDWNDKKIVVMNSVIIEPPYDVSNCYSKKGENTQALEHVKKIVRKFHEDYKVSQQQDQSPQKPMSYSNVTSSSISNDK